MRKYFLNTIMLIMLFSTQVVLATADPCLQLFQKAFKQMKEASTLTQGKGLAVEYTMLTETIDGQQFQDRLSLSSFGGKTKFTSSEAIMYQDNKAMVVVQPTSKVVYLTKVIKPDPLNSPMHKLFQSQDSIIRKLVVKSCIHQTEQSGTDIKIITLEVPQSLRARLGVRSLVYSIVESTAVVKEVRINYNVGESNGYMKTLTVTFTKFSTDFNNVPFEAGAVDNVMDAKGRLLPKYTNFSIIDERN